MQIRILITLVCALLVRPLFGADSVIPYSADSVPQNAVDLWADADFHKDPLETEIVEEWSEDGIVCRYVIFKVGTFKGADSRIAAFYTFPEGMKNGPAFVWSHGGGQRADRERGAYFARHGYATVDINWGGRELVDGIEENTDWGNVDPSQGPRFYPGALRPSVKLNLLPDEHTIDPVTSPRNGNWYLLTYAARRAITFLEEQAEVDPERIGFTGYSMGGNITSYAAIDGRLKAVAPMVGGSGFLTRDFPGLPESSRAASFKDHADLFAATMDAQVYWRETRCPVLFLSASNDFHAIFENVYDCTEVLPHENWRVSMKTHYNHSLGPEQWILLNRWFDRYLKDDGGELPKTARSNLEVDEAKGTAVFTATPDRSEEIASLDVYYSHDPNPRTRFWIHAEATRDGETWRADLPVREKLPLFAYANCRYPLGEAVESFQGKARSFTITSREEVHLPGEIDAALLKSEARPGAVFEDFAKNGFRDWGFGPRGGISTYKFQDPRLEIPGADRALRVTVNVPREKMSFRFRLSKKGFLTGVKGPKESFSATKNFGTTGEHQFILKASDFTDGDKSAMTDWNHISDFIVGVYDGGAKVNLDFTEKANDDILSKLEWTKAIETGKP